MYVRPMPVWTLLSDVDCPECLLEVLDGRLVAEVSGTREAALLMRRRHRRVCVGVTPAPAGCNVTAT